MAGDGVATTALGAGAAEVTGAATSGATTVGLRSTELAGGELVPVVKSYPQFSQKSAPATAVAPQVGQVIDEGVGAGGAEATGAGLAVAIGSPQVSQ